MLLGPAADNSPSVRYKHYYIDAKVQVQDLRTHMEAVHGEEFAEVDVAKWIDCAGSAGLDSLIASYLEAVT